MIEPFDTSIIDASWNNLIAQEEANVYFKELRNFIASQRAAFTIYPPASDVFRAFSQTTLQSTKVVLLGQDPYHQPDQAHGLAFSVPCGVKKPPSLRNILKELQEDCGIPQPSSGDLTKWAQRGVLLLNTTLTVRRDIQLSNAGHGWERFTDTVITTLSRAKSGLVFLLWGKHAQSKEQLIDSNRHSILKAAHPSPFSAHNGFFGCRHFSRTNALLLANGAQPIDWRLE